MIKNERPDLWDLIALLGFCLLAATLVFQTQRVDALSQRLADLEALHGASVRLFDERLEKCVGPLQEVIAWKKARQGGFAAAWEFERRAWEERGE